MKILAECPSSSPSERNWSSYDFVHSKKRNSLTPFRAAMLAYVFNNVRSLKKQVAGKQARFNRLEQEAIEAMNSFVDESGDEGDDM
jgi:hypothetical protein